MNKSITMLLATLALALAQPASAQQDTPKVQTLRGAGTADMDQAPEDKPYVGKPPGSQKPIARTFSGQPPLIPHTVENFDAITLEGNLCLSCHGPANYKYTNAPKVGDSHFKDRDGKRLTGVSPARHQCTTCHVPQANAKPLVENTFKGNVATVPKKK